MFVKLKSWLVGLLVMACMCCVTTAIWARSLTLEDSMSLAEDRSQSVKMAQAQYEAVQAQEKQSWGLLGPKVVAEGNALWVNGMQGQGQKASGGGDSHQLMMKGSIGIVQPIIGMAAIIMKVKADILASQVGAAEVELTKRQMRFKAAELYIQMQKAQHLVNVSMQSLHVVEKQLSDAKAMQRVGKLSRVDVLRFESAFNEARSNYTQAQIAAKMAKVALAELLGFDSQEPLYVKDLNQSHWEERQKKLPGARSVLDVALKNTTEIQSIEKKKKIAGYYQLAAELDYTPSLNFVAKYERDFNPSKKVSYSGGFKDTLSYGLNLQWALWDWGSRNGKIDEARAQVKSLELALESSQSAIRVSVNQSVLQLQQALEALSPALSQVKLAEEVFKLTQLKFDNGSASTSDLITAQRDQSGARANLANVRGNLDLAWFNVQKVMGIKPSVKDHL